MICVKRLIALFLSAFLVFSLSACSTDAQRAYAIRRLAFEQAKYLDSDFQLIAISHHKLREGCRDKMNVMFFVTNHNDGLNADQILVNDLYMLDLDTGHWYYDGIIDENALNFDTKENALMYFYRAFDLARGEYAISDGDFHVDYLTADEVALVNQMRAQSDAGNSLKFLGDTNVSQTISPVRLFTISETLNQPAGLARDTVMSLDEALVYLNLRFPAYSEDALSVTSGSDHVVRSGIEIFEDEELPVTYGDIPNCVTYLLSDSFEIDTLVAFLEESSDDGIVPKTINMIKMEDGYWFFNPIELMNPGAEAKYHGTLPTMKCGSVKQYVEILQEQLNVQCVVKVSDGSRMEYAISESGEIIITTDSDCVELVYSRAGV